MCKFHAIFIRLARGTGRFDDGTGNQTPGNGNDKGNHDAVEAGEDVIAFAASEAYSAFGFGEPGRMTPLLFLFGSVDSLLKAGNKLFDKLTQLQFYCYINIGFESLDAPTLAYIGKPVDESEV